MTARRLSHDDKIRIARGAERLFVSLRDEQMEDARLIGRLGGFTQALGKAADSGRADACAVQLAELVRELEAQS